MIREHGLEQGYGGAQAPHAYAHLVNAFRAPRLHGTFVCHDMAQTFHADHSESLGCRHSGMQGQIACMGLGRFSTVRQHVTALGLAADFISAV